MNQNIAHPAVVIHGRLDPSYQKAAKDSVQILAATNDEVQHLINQRKAMWAQDAAAYKQWMYTTSGMHTGSALPPIGGMTGNTSFFANAHGTANQQRIVEAQQRYEDAVTTYYDQQTAQFKVLTAARRLDANAYGTISTGGMSPAALAVYAEEARAKAAQTAGRIGGSIPGPVGLSPAALAAYGAEAAQRQQATMSRLDAYGRPRATVGLSPAAQAANAADDAEAFRRTRLTAGRLADDPYGQNARQLSPAAQSNINEEAAIRRNAMLRQMAGQEGSSIVAGSQWERQALGGVIRRRAEMHSSQDMSDPRHMFASITRYQAEQDRIAGYRQQFGHHFGGLNANASNRFRFAAQNVGFGVDDAIQSYQYGGYRASIRAASNNVTAVAGMMINQPMIAAAAVIAISAASAALPVIMDKFGLRKAFQDLSNKERHQLFAESPAMYRLQERNAEYGKVASLTRRLGETGQDFDKNFAEAAMGGRASSFMLTQGEEALKRSRDFALLGSEAKELEAANRRIHNSNDTSETARKAIDENETRLREIRREQRTINRQNAAFQIDVLANGGSLAQLNDMDRTRRGYDLDMTLAMNRGDITVGDYDHKLKQKAQIDRQIVELSVRGVEEKRFAMAKIDLELYDALNDPNKERRIKDVNFESQVRSRGSLFSRSGDRSVIGQMTFDYNEQQKRYDYDLAMGQMSDKEYSLQSGSLSQNFKRDRQRAIEDELLNANPERNPLARLSTSLKRRMQDVELETGKTPEERRKLMLATLQGYERERKDLLEPGGQRRYISQGYQVGSLEDEELRARMVGNFGSPEKPVDRTNQTLEQILTALTEFAKSLDIEAANLEGK